jgi:hypothetical protein
MRPLLLTLSVVALSFGAAVVSVAPAAAVTADDGYVYAPWTFTIKGHDPDHIHPGDTVKIDGSGLPAGMSVNCELHSIPVQLGSAAVGASGSFSETVTIPRDTVLGIHHIIVTASAPGEQTTTREEAITVIAPIASAVANMPVVAPAASSDVSAPVPTSITAPSSSAKSEFGHPAQPGIQANILTQALTPITDVLQNPNKIVSAVQIGLVLLLLAVLPAHLLNSTLAEQSDRIERRFPHLRKEPHWMVRFGVWLKSVPVIGGIVVTAITALVLGFADPTFGFTLASARLVLACGIALFFVGYVANALTAIIARRRWSIVAAVSTRPYGLILTVAGVLVSRLIHFSPGFLVGLILGLTIQGKSASGYAWRVVVVRTSIVLGMSVAAWIGYSTLTLGGNEGGTFSSELFVETLVAITTEGVVALMIELLPLRFLEGERVYAHSRLLWAGFYFVTVVVFVLAVIPWSGNWDALGNSLWIWAAILVAFAAVCVGVYIYFRNFAKPLVEVAGSEEVALAETVAGDNS